MNEKEKRDRILEIIYKWLTDHVDYVDLSEEEIIANHPSLHPDLGEILGRAGKRRGEARLRETTAFAEGSPRGTREVGGMSLEPGILLMNRFYIIRSLGEGAMGSVYLASDSELRKEKEKALVALKLLRHAPGDRESSLRNEVTAVRRVLSSHVCQVYEFHPNQGNSFVTMEYVDGQDLESLLKYVGRFPGDRVREIAVQSCRGLHAAHQEGVIHRDIKPANIMIEAKKGNVRLMDFGLATLHLNLRASGPVGTPAYMAPEQWEGRPTYRSDIYSLGVVLYQLATGRHPFEECESRFEECEFRPKSDFAPVAPRDDNPDLDRFLDRVILLCLDYSPEKRPDSASEMLQMLGEEPASSVSKSDKRTRRTRGRAVLWFVLTMVGLLVGVLMSPLLRFVEHAGFMEQPEYLEGDAREIVKKLGYETQTHDGQPIPTASGYQYDKQFRNVPSLASEAVYFWYRQSPQRFATTRFVMGRDNAAAQVTYLDPPLFQEGMLGIRMRPSGRLIEFRGVTGFVAEVPGRTTAPDEWDALFAHLFEAAKLDYTSRTVTSSTCNPAVRYDVSKVWECEANDDGIRRVEGATSGNRVTWFRVSEPVTGAEEAHWFRTVSSVFDETLHLSFIGIAVLAVLVQRWAARRLGQSDRTAAVRLAGIVGVLCLFSWLFSSNHFTSSLAGEVRSLRLAAANALLWAVTTWILFRALEPFLRHYAGRQLTSWNHWIHGRYDAAVGEDILVGCLAGSLSVPVLGSFNVGCRWFFGWPERFSIPYPPTLAPLANGYTVFAEFCNALTNAIYSVFALLLFLLAIQGFVSFVKSRFCLARQERVNERKTALFVVWLVITSFLFFYYGESAPTSWFWFLYMGLWVALLLYIINEKGLLAAIAMAASLQILVVSPVTNKTYLWYFGTGMAGVTAVAAIALAGFLMGSGLAGSTKPRGSFTWGG